jgi:hypothetical protein
MPPLNLYARVRISLRTLRTRPRVQRAPRHSLHPSWGLHGTLGFSRVNPGQDSGVPMPRDRAAMSFCKARRALNEPVPALSHCFEIEIVAGELGFPTTPQDPRKSLIYRRIFWLPMDWRGQNGPHSWTMQPPRWRRTDPRRRQGLLQVFCAFPGGQAMPICRVSHYRRVKLDVSALRRMSAALWLRRCWIRVRQ